MRPEESCLRFYGEIPEAFAFLGTMEGGLVRKTLDKHLAALELDALVGLILAEAEGLERVTGEQGASFTMRNKLPREERLKREFTPHVTGKSLIFRYGERKSRREAKRIKVFPWGIRGVVNGLKRNFSWEKIETDKVSLTRNYRLEILSKRTRDRRSFSLRFYECDSAGTHRKELKSSGFSTKLAKLEEFRVPW